MSESGGVFSDHVDPHAVPGGEAVATDAAHRLSAVPGQVLAAPGGVGEDLAAAGHRADRASTCQNNGPESAQSQSCGSASARRARLCADPER